MQEPSFSGLPSFRLHTLAKLVDQHAEASHRLESGLGLLECRIVGVVGAHGPLSFKRLCELAELEKSNASRLVSRMVEQGWVERQDDPGDQRSFFLLPTAAGRRLRRSIHRQAQARNEAWLSVLTAEQRRCFSTCLDLLSQQARAMSRGAPGSAGAADGGGSPTRKATARAAEGSAARLTEADRDAADEHEPARLAWIDRRLADQLYGLLGAALHKHEETTP